MDTSLIILEEAERLLLERYADVASILNLDTPASPTRCQGPRGRLWEEGLDLYGRVPRASPTVIPTRTLAATACNETLAGHWRRWPWTLAKALRRPSQW